MMSKRFSLLLLAAAFLVGCGPSKIPSDFTSNGLSNTGSELDPRGSGFSTMADRIRQGNIPPEAILTTVYFEFDKYTVDAKERAKLDAIAAKAKTTKLIIAGYTDHFGTPEYNLGLSDKRAQSTREYLVKLGCNTNNTEVMALGSQQADPNASGRQSGAKDRKAVVVDANYSGPVTAPAGKPAAKPAGTPAPRSNAPTPAPVTAL